MDEINSKIILYPSNWLYNAGVVGFLRVLESKNKMNDIEFTPHGEILIPDGLFRRNSDLIFPAIKFLTEYITKDENLEEWLDKKDKKGKSNEEKYNDYVKKFSDKVEGYRYIRAGGKWFFGTNTPYQNLIQKKEWENFEFVCWLEESISEETNENNLSCCFCKKKTIPLQWLQEDNLLKKRILVFSDPHTDELGASLGKFPNSFWNNQNSILICPLCVFMFIHHRIAFQSFNGQQIFINTPHFLLTWDLNKFAEKILKRQVRKLLGSSLLQWAIKRRTLLGAWTMMNIEVVVKRKVKIGKNKWETIIDYFDLPYHITRVLLDYEIADLINRIGEEKIFDLVVSGKFSELEKANYFVLRAFLKLKNNEKLSDNDPVSKYVDNYTNRVHLSKISNLLPELYAKIIKTLKTEVKHG